MNFNLNNDQILTLLTVLHIEYSNSKVYYTKHKSDEERIGITSPDEIKKVYNSILIKVQKEQDIFLSLEPIK